MTDSEKQAVPQRVAEDAPQWAIDAADEIRTLDAWSDDEVFLPHEEWSGENPISRHIASIIASHIPDVQAVTLERDALHKAMCNLSRKFTNIARLTAENVENETLSRIESLATVGLAIIDEIGFAQPPAANPHALQHAPTTFDGGPDSGSVIDPPPVAKGLEWAHENECLWLAASALDDEGSQFVWRVTKHHTLDCEGGLVFWGIHTSDYELLGPNRPRHNRMSLADAQAWCEARENEIREAAGQ